MDHIEFARGTDSERLEPGEEGGGCCADWQFLLPLRLGRVLLLSTGTDSPALARAVEGLVLAQVSPPERSCLNLSARLARVVNGSGHRRFDTVVAIGDLTLLDRHGLLREALAAPGQLYLAARMGPRACRRARRRLQELRFVNVRSYLLVPHHRTPHFYLSDDEPAASRQFLRHCWPLIENKDLRDQPVLQGLRGAARPLVRALRNSRHGHWITAAVPHRAIIAEHDR